MTLRTKVSGRIAKPVHEVFEAVADPARLSKYFATGAGTKGRLETGAIVTWEFHDFPGAFPVKLFGDYMSNPGTDTNNHGYFAGVAFGKAGKKGTWDFTYRYRVIQSDAWYEELADSDSGAFYQAAPAGGASGYGGGTNVRGHIFQGNYALNDAALVGFTYFATRLINPSPAGSESGMGRLQVNTILKF